MKLDLKYLGEGAYGTVVEAKVNYFQIHLFIYSFFVILLFILSFIH